MKSPIAKTIIASIVAAGVASAAGCGTHEKPNFIYMPDMYYAPSIKAQKVGSMRMPVAGTIPRGYVPFPYPKTPEGEAAAGRELKNPLKPTKAVMERGKFMFNTYCIECHGPAGEGDGTIVPRFPRPPSLQSDKIRNWPDGTIYHHITLGGSLMPSYASQIAPADRWAIINYLRALQKSKNPTAEDLKAAEAESQ